MKAKSLPDLWRAAASRHAERPYIRVGDESVTYGEAQRTMRQIGRAIETAGWGTVDRPLAVHLRDPLALTQVIGACVQRGISLAFIPDYRTAALLRSTTDETGARFLVSDSPDLLGLDWVVPIERVMDSADHTTPEREDEALHAASGSFILQTSGTAGEPQWVVCRYRQCFSAIEGMHASGALQHAKGQSVYLTSPLSHSYGLSVLLEYTSCCSTLCFPFGETRLGPLEGLFRTGIRSEITAIEGVPYFYSQLCRVASRVSLPNLRHIGVGAGALPQELVDLARGHWPDVDLGVRYGLTETPSAVTQKVFPVSHAQQRSGSGRVTGAYRIAILDDRGRHLPSGQEGEVAVFGDCLGTYLGESAQGELRTGDRGLLDASGELHVIGRHSAFLKHRGFRLSPERLEAVLMTLPGVRDCRLVMEGEQLVAEVVTAADDLEERRLLRLLAAQVPSYCVPDRVVRLAEIPRTRTGKVRRY